MPDFTSDCFVTPNEFVSCCSDSEKAELQKALSSSGNQYGNDAHKFYESPVGVKALMDEKWRDCKISELCDSLDHRGKENILRVAAILKA